MLLALRIAFVVSFIAIGYAQTALESGVPMPGHLTTGAYAYYTIPTSASDTQLTVLVTPTSETGNVRLYVRANGQASATAYDYLDTTTQPEHAILIAQPFLESGVYSIAVRATRTGDFNITATLSSSCPDICASNLAACSNSLSCICNYPFAGPWCQEDGDSLATQGIVSGIAPSGQFVYYFVDVENSFTTSLTVTLTRTSAFGSTRLLLGYGFKPTISTFNKTCNSLSGPGCSLSLHSPGLPNGRVYIGVGVFVGSSALEYNISATTESVCPNFCTGHGVCNATASTCSCVGGYQGADCSQLASTQPGTVYSGTLPRFLFAYYNFSISAAPVTLTTFASAFGVGDVDLYVRYGAVPSLTQYDAYVQSNLQNSTLSITAQNNGVYVIGVYARTQVDYELFVTTEPVPTPAPTPVEEHRSLLWIIGVVAGGVVLLAVVVIITCKTRGKNKPQIANPDLIQERLLN